MEITNGSGLNLGSGMGMNRWEWDGMGLKKTFPLISTYYIDVVAGIIALLTDVFDLKVFALKLRYRRKEPVESLQFLDPTFHVEGIPKFWTTIFKSGSHPNT